MAIPAAVAIARKRDRRGVAEDMPESGRKTRSGGLVARLLRTTGAGLARAGRKGTGWPTRTPLALAGMVREGAGTDAADARKSVALGPTTEPRCYRRLRVAGAERSGRKGSLRADRNTAKATRERPSGGSGDAGEARNVATTIRTEPVSLQASGFRDGDRKRSVRNPAGLSGRTGGADSQARSRARAFGPAGRSKQGERGVGSNAGSPIVCVGPIVMRRRGPSRLCSRRCGIPCFGD